MFIFTQNSLAQGPWTFTNSNDGWASTGTNANVTASATYSVLDINGAGNPQITRSDANVDGTALYYAIIKIKNNTSNTLMRFIYDTTGTNRFTDTQISANDTEFKTYYVRVDNHADWNTNPVNNVTIQFRADHTTPSTTANDDGLGNIYIDDLTMSTEIERTDFTFNNPEDNGGFEAFGQASLNQNATTGVYELTATNDKYPGLGLVNNFKVPATANRFVAITFDTNTATTVNQITIKIIDPTDQYLNLSITAASGVLQTVVMDLNGKTSWNADETSFVISFREQAGGAQFFSGQINVHRVLFFNTEWTGQTDTDWATTTNWSSGAVPLITDPIHIPSGLTNNPIIGSTTGANAKDIINDGSITINSGGSLIVDGSSSGNVTYNRTLTTPAETGDFNADKLEGWYLMSSPVAGDDFNNDFISNNSLASGTGNNRGLATYAENSNTWDYFEVGETGNFSSGLGYSIKRSTTGDVSFTGAINTADVTTASLARVGDGLQLVGNPYTSYISSEDFLNNNANVSDNKTIWTWNSALKSFTSSIPIEDFTVAPGQGFFIEINSGGGALNFNESNQLHGTDNFQKSEKTSIKLKVQDNNTFREARIYYTEGASKGFESGYEGEVFKGIPNNFEVFTQLLENNIGKNYQVQTLPNTDYETMIIPVGVIAVADKELTFTAEAMNFPTDLKVYLEDRDTNTFTRLDEANTKYKITVTNTLDGIGRFYLHTSQKALSVTPNFVAEHVSIYKANSSTLRIAGLSQGKASVKLFNILGREVLNTSFTSNGLKDIALPRLAKGVYVVQLTTGAFKVNKKIILE